MTRTLWAGLGAAVTGGAPSKGVMLAAAAPITGTMVRRRILMEPRSCHLSGHDPRRGGPASKNVLPVPRADRDLRRHPPTRVSLPQHSARPAPDVRRRRAPAHRHAAAARLLRARLQLGRDVPRHPGPGHPRRRVALRGRDRPQAAARPVSLRRDVLDRREHGVVVCARRRDARRRDDGSDARGRGSPTLRRPRGVDRGGVVRRRVRRIRAPGRPGGQLRGVHAPGDDCRRAARERGRARGSGMAVALATLAKQTGAATLLPVLYLAWRRDGRRGIGRGARRHRDPAGDRGAARRSERSVVLGRRRQRVVLRARHRERVRGGPVRGHDVRVPRLQPAHRVDDPLGVAPPLSAGRTSTCGCGCSRRRCRSRSGSASSVTTTSSCCRRWPC